MEGLKLSSVEPQAPSIQRTKCHIKQGSVKSSKNVLKFSVYSVLEPAVGYLTTLHFNSQQGTRPTLV